MRRIVSVVCGLVAMVAVPPVRAEAARGAEGRAGWMTPGIRAVGMTGRDAPSAWDVKLPSKGRWSARVSGAPDVDVAVEGGCAEESRESRRPDGSVAIRFGSPRKGTCTIRVTTTSPDRLPGALEVEAADPAGNRGRLPGTCGPLGKEYRPVSLAAIRARPGRWDGRTVRLAGRATVEGITCTAMACPGRGCCNSCGATMVFRGTPRSLRDGTMDERHIVMDGLQCGGNECTVRDGCPFPNGRRITAWGTWSGAEASRKLALEGACGGFQGSAR